MKKNYMLLLFILPLFTVSCSDDSVAPTVTNTAPALEINQLFDKRWHQNGHQGLMPEIGFTSSGIYEDPGAGNGVWVWEEEENQIMRITRNGDIWLQKFVEVSAETMVFKFENDDVNNPDWLTARLNRYDAVKKE